MDDDLGYQLKVEREGKEGKCKTCYNARLDALEGWSPCMNAGCAFHPKNEDGYFPQYQNREEMEKEFGPRKVEPTILVPRGLAHKPKERR